MTDRLLHAALISGTAAVALAGSILFAVIVLRGIHIFRDNTRRRFLEIWRPLLLQSVMEMPAELPVVPRSRAGDFLDLWNHLQESLRGDAKDRLNDIARRTGVDALAVRQIRGGPLGRRLMAIWTLGHLKDKKEWDTLIRFTRHRHPMLSCVAARAMARIDPAAAVPIIIPHVVKRTDWSPVRVAGMLKEMDPALTVPPLMEAIEQAPASSLPRLIAYLEIISPDRTSPIARQILTIPRDAATTAAALRLIRQPKDRSLVLTFGDSDDEHVRAEAARALGRIGTDEDIPQLLGLISDPVWDVRAAAARALVGAPGGDPNRFFSEASVESAPLAQEILTHAIAEKEWGMASR